MNLGELEQKIQDRQNQEKRLQEEAVLQSLENFRKDLNKSFKSVSLTIENNMQELCRANNSLIALTKKNYCIYLTGIILLFFLIMAGSRLISFYMTSKIQSLEEEIQSLELQKQQAEKTLSALKTMGIVLQNINGKNFIILPEPLSAEAGWEVGGKKAVRIYK